MLITEKLSISNTKQFISNQQMFEILYHAFVKEINLRNRQKKRLFDSDKDQLAYSLRNAGSEWYNRCRTIMLSNMIFDFLDWKPYIKTFNYVAIADFLIRKCKLKWSIFRYAKGKISFVDTDHHIRMLYGLWEKGLYFKDFDHTPKAIKKLMSLELYGQYFLDQLFEKDFRKDRMDYFSTSRIPGPPYWNYDSYYYRRRRRAMETYDEISIQGYVDYQNQDIQTLNAQFTININTEMGTGHSATTSTAADYAIYQPAAATSGTNYNDSSNSPIHEYYSTTGGEIAWTEVIES